MKRKIMFREVTQKLLPRIVATTYNRKKGDANFFSEKWTNIENEWRDTYIDKYQGRKAFWHLVRQLAIGQQGKIGIEQSFSNRFDTGQ